MGRRSVCVACCLAGLAAVVFSQCFFQLGLVRDSLVALQPDSGNSASAFAEGLHTSSIRLRFISEQRQEDRFAIRVCSETDSVTSKNETQVLREFCLSCPLGMGQTSCGRNASYRMHRYNLTAAASIKALVQSNFENCCPEWVEPFPYSLPEEGAVPEVLAEEQPVAETAWCILGGNNTPPSDWIINLSHASQALVPCWSYFCRVWERNPETKCGIWFQPPQHSVFQSHWDLRQQHWVGPLMKAMNCTYIFGDDEVSPLVQGNHTTASTWHYRPKQYTLLFQHPADATKLARKLQLNTRPSSPSEPLHIGLVQRRGHRRNITNLPKLQGLIRLAYPQAIVEWGEMEDRTFWEQATFWNRQDVILAAHGAAATNAMFMRRHTAFIEIFPIHYYGFMYRELCVGADIHYFSWLDDVDYPEFDFMHHAAVRQVRFALRANPMTPPIERIMGLVHKAVNATTSSMARNHKNMGNHVMKRR